MKRKLAVITLLVLLLGVALAGYMGLTYYNVHKRPNFSNKYVLYVYPEMTVAQVLDSLQAGAGTIRPKSVERVF